ncbi:MAG: HAD-IA family hydrolase [Candidatus Pacearchaeota archaeon]
MNKEIKAIVFDIGGVLCEEQNQVQYQKLSKEFNFDIKSFELSRNKHVWKSLKNPKSTFEYESLIAEDLGINKNRFIKSWQKLRDKHICLKKEKKEILRKLKNNYILVSFTNVNPAHELLRKKNKIYSLFDLNIKSCECGLAKPSTKFFKYLIKDLKKYNVSAEEAVFIDDRKNNIPPARKLGLKTILFKTNNQLEKELKKLGVKI